MVTSDAYKTLSKVLGALRAHDTDTIEALADPRIRSGRGDIDGEDQEHDVDDAEDVLEDGDGAAALSGTAARVLRFSEDRDPAVLAQFVRLRVIDPEGAHWRRGVEAADRWLRETGNTVLRVPYTAVTPEDWGTVGGYPLGQWIAEQHRAYTTGTLEAGRVGELEKLGMVWSEQEAAWGDGIAVAKEYAAVHGRFLPSTTTAWEGHPIGAWAKNARAAARRTRENEELRATGLPVPSAAGAMTQARQEKLDAIDPGWCPVSNTGWQRCYRLVQNHVQAGGALPTSASDVLVQGEDLGRWVNAQRFGWEQLLPAQEWILENTLKLTEDPGTVLYGHDHLQRMSAAGQAENVRLVSQLPTETRCAPIPGGMMAYLPGQQCVP
ncbi:helicase associated domain-containing protein [Streptomyces sp. NBC_01005]|uniref:helicase associated domain-containing protein n=1 Tax=Streptomyces sp. NBC_01005 TaxID=2903715 RepID=UPI003867764D|nr:helicase associated domain-containing protein [Streptomyces sp. NBC_01005]